MFGYDDSLLRLGKPRSRNFHIKKEGSLFEKEAKAGKRKRPKTFHVYNENNTSVEEHRIPLMEKNINTIVGEAKDDSNNVDMIQSQMSRVSIIDHDEANEVSRKTTLSPDNVLNMVSIDDDVILVDDRIDIATSFYDAVADSEEELEPLSSSSQFVTNLSSVLSTFPPTCDDFCTQYSNANFQGEDMTANCLTQEESYFQTENPEDDIDQVRSDDRVQNIELFNDDSGYLIERGTNDDEMTNEYNSPGPKIDEVNDMNLKEVEANEIDSKDQYTETSVIHIEPTTNCIKVNDSINHNNKVKNTEITVHENDIINNPLEETSTIVTIKKPIKRASSLADICSKTNGARLRVGLSKRAKIDSLHGYLSR